VSRGASASGVAAQEPSSSLNGVLLTAEEVAKRLAVPVSWVYAEARAGRLPYVPLGRYKRFSWASIEAWLSDRECGPEPYRRYGRSHSQSGGQAS
jgi:excisionase family DNA binding protein